MNADHKLLESRDFLFHPLPMEPRTNTLQVFPSKATLSGDTLGVGSRKEEDAELRSFGCGPRRLRHPKIRFPKADLSQLKFPC